MNKPNINLKYKEQDGMLLPNLQISNSSEEDRPLGPAAAGTGLPGPRVGVLPDPYVSPLDAPP